MRPISYECRGAISAKNNEWREPSAGEFCVGCLGGVAVSGGAVSVGKQTMKLQSLLR